MKMNDQENIVLPDPAKPVRRTKRRKSALTYLLEQLASSILLGCVLLIITGTAFLLFPHAVVNTSLFIERVVEGFVSLSQGL